MTECGRWVIDKLAEYRPVPLVKLPMGAFLFATGQQWRAKQKEGGAASVLVPQHHSLLTATAAERSLLSLFS